MEVPGRHTFLGFAPGVVISVHPVGQGSPWLVSN